MIDLLIFIVLICLLAYFYYHPINHTNNVASTLLQIWTGSCNLSCRQSGYSRFSGMSGLNQPPLSPSPDTTAGGESQRNLVLDLTNMAINCVCHPCPCGHIETIIRTCRPATDFYARNMELLGFYLYSSFELISDTYEKFTNAMQCGTSCQRQAQFVRTSKEFVFASNENLTFDREKTDGKKNQNNKTLFPKISEMLHMKNRSETIEKGRSETAVVKEAIETMKKPEAKNKSEDTAKPNSSIQFKNDNAGPSQSIEDCPTAQQRTDQMPPCGSCPKCLQDGKVCISKCPKAKDR